MTIAHWDDAPVEVSPLDDVLRVRAADLGTAAGSVGVGCVRWWPEPGGQTTPAHVEGAEEEIFFVLGGTGWSWQDAATYEVRAGDVLVHLAGTQAHTLVGGDDGLDVLAFGPRIAVQATWLPRAGLLRVQNAAVEAQAGWPLSWEREAAAGRVELGEPQPRPSTIAALADLERAHTRRGRVDRTRRDLGRAVGSVRTGLTHLEIAPGGHSSTRHCHSAEEELFVVLEGDGELLLGDERHPVRAGSVVARPPGTGIAHAFAAGDAGMVLLAYGTREPNDLCWYPDSGKVSFRGLGVIARVTDLDYWDGEE